MSKHFGKAEKMHQKPSIFYVRHKALWKVHTEQYIASDENCFEGDDLWIKQFH
jgi:hypothetical protein